MEGGSWSAHCWMWWSCRRTLPTLPQVALAGAGWISSQRLPGGGMGSMMGARFCLCLALKSMAELAAVSMVAVVVELVIGMARMLVERRRMALRRGLVSSCIFVVVVDESTSVRWRCCLAWCCVALCCVVRYWLWYVMRAWEEMKRQVFKASCFCLYTDIKIVIRTSN